MSSGHQLSGKTHKPNIITSNSSNPYVIIGAVDHGLEIPQTVIMELLNSLNGVSALMMESPEETHQMMHPMSTELLAKVSVGNVPIQYLSGNSIKEDIGDKVLKYSPENIAEVYIPCLYMRNTIQMGHEPTMRGLVGFVSAYQQRFGFIDVERTLENYAKVLDFWGRNDLAPTDLDHFSYDFEKFVGDIREFELWTPELKGFREQYPTKIAVCCGDYHTPFVQSVLDGNKQRQPNWKTHLDERREDKLTPQDTNFLKRVYQNLETALNS